MTRARPATLFLSTLALLPLLLGAAGPDPVVAVHGKDELTAGEVRALIAALPAEQRRAAAANPRAVNGLIRDALLGRALLTAARDSGWAARPDVKALAQRAYDSAVVQSFVAAQARVPEGYPTEADLKAAWEANKAQLMRPRTYRLTQIFAALPADAPATAREEAKKRALEAYKDLSRGRATVEQAAKRLGAQVSDMGWIAETQLLANVKDVVAGLPEGQVSAPICGAAGCTLLKLVQTRPAGPAPLEEVRASLTQALRQQKQRELEQAYANSILSKPPVMVDEIAVSRMLQP